MMLPTKTILIIGVLIKNKSSKPINIIRSVWEAQIENDETMRQYDFDTRNQQRDYQMSIRDYEFGQTMRMFDQQVRAT